MKRWIIVYTLGGDPEVMVLEADDVMQALCAYGYDYGSIISISGVILNN